MPHSGSVDGVLGGTRHGDPAQRDSVTQGWANGGESTLANIVPISMILRAATRWTVAGRPQQLYIREYRVLGSHVLSPVAVQEARFIRSLALGRTRRLSKHARAAPRDL